MLTTKALIPIEVQGQLDALEQAQARLAYGQSMGLAGPNIASLLLLVLLPHLVSSNFCVHEEECCHEINKVNNTNTLVMTLGFVRPYCVLQ